MFARGRWTPTEAVLESASSPEESGMVVEGERVCAPTERARWSEIRFLVKFYGELHKPLAQDHECLAC